MSVFPLFRIWTQFFGYYKHGQNKAKRKKNSNSLNQYRCGCCVCFFLFLLRVYYFRIAKKNNHQRKWILFDRRTKGGECERERNKKQIKQNERKTVFDVCLLKQKLCACNWMQTQLS